jgi:hypothetical protein
MWNIRRLFVVVLAPNGYGKSTLVRALLAQGTGEQREFKHGHRSLVTPWGRRIESVVFVRSFQEAEKNQHGTVKAALDARYEKWDSLDLVVLPSHLVPADVRQMIAVGHNHGFDCIAASVLRDGTPHAHNEACWGESWDERWTLNTHTDPQGWEAQARAMGCDLWTWISRAMLP